MAIREVIAGLDGAVPRDGARVSLVQYGGGPDESQIIANQDGYLRLGIECMKAAFSAKGASDSNTPNAIVLDLGYLLTSDSTIHFDWCERREPESNPDRPGSIGDRLVPALLLGFVTGFLGLTLIGLVTVLRWLFG